MKVGSVVDEKYLTTQGEEKMKALLLARQAISLGAVVGFVYFLNGCSQPEVTGEKIGENLISLTVSPDPPVVGVNTFVVSVSDKKRNPLTGATLHIHYSMPAMAGMPAMQNEIQAKEVKPGHYEAEVDFSAGGKFPWDVRVELTQDQQLVAVTQWNVTPETRGVRFTNGQSDAGVQGELDYYTCTMHPSVKEKDPGTCPICAMNLVPVYKNGMQPQQQIVKKQIPTVNIPLYQQQLIGVQFDTVKAISVDKTVRTVGIVAYDERKLATVNLKFSGWIEKLFVDFTGKQVKRGGPLFAIYSPELVSTQEEFLQTQRDTTRSFPLIPTSGKRVQRFRSQDSYARTAEERLLLWGLSKAQIDEIARQGTPKTAVTFYSPTDGYVIEKNILEGSKAEAGTDLYTIADLASVWVYADIYEFELPFVAVGQKALITLPYDPNAKYSGKVDYIYPTLDSRSRTAKIRVVVPNPEMQLLPNMYTNVEISINMGVQLTVVETSVLDTGTRQLVFVDRGNGRFEPRVVRVGSKVDGRYTVLDGLQRNEVVVKSGNFLIDAEAHVQGVLQTM